MAINIRREFASVGLSAGREVFAPRPLPSGDLEAAQATGGAVMKRFSALGRAIDKQANVFVQEGQAIGRLGEQIQLAGSEVARTFSGIEARRKEARDRSRAATARIQGLREADRISREEFENSDPAATGYADRVSRGVQTRFAELANEIEDDDLRANVSDDLGLIAVRTEIAARQAEARKEAEFLRGELDKRLAASAAQAMQFDGPEQVQIMSMSISDIRDAVDEGIISPETGNRKIAAFRLGVLNGTLDQALAGDPEQAKQTLEDGGYEHLFADPGERTEAASKIETEILRRRKDTVLLLERQERLADKRRKDAQEANAITVWQAAQSSGLTVQQLDEIARNRQITKSDWLSIRKMLTEDDTPEDDPKVVVDIHDGIIQGRVSRADIFDAFDDGKITQQTTTRLLDKLAIEGRRDDPFTDVVQSHDYKLATDAVRRAIITTGAMQALDPGQQERYSNALIELDNRIRKRLAESEPITPEWMAETRDNIRERYRSEFSIPILGLPRSGYIDSPVGAIKDTDILTAESRLMRDYQDKKISFDKFNEEAILLERYREALNE